MSESNGQAQVAELYRKYRPTKLKDVVGQPGAVNTIKGLLQKGNFPHTILLTGPSGTGKTTLARIVADKLQCAKNDFLEVNAADFRGIDTIREVRSVIRNPPLAGPVRIWLFDECHSLSSDAQEAMLKILEEAPSYAYFFFCTTNPAKVKSTILSRGTVIHTRPVAKDVLYKLLVDVCAKEGLKLHEQVGNKIADYSEGGARKALVILQQVVCLPTEQEQLDAIEKGDVKVQSIELCKVLTDRKRDWSHAAPILLGLKDQEAESIRRHVLAWATNGLLKRRESNCYHILVCFECDQFWGTGAAGFGSLVRASYEVLQRRNER